MAKRRNPKKEKALRNLEYARKFRKRSGSGRNNFRRGRPGSGGPQDEDQEQDQSSTSEGAAD
ncbi:hypothetical protein ACQ4M4_10280 [Leptolyngbya sp. AN02str]|uniref:hypothetical protein n=1 Tax=Leptolyngbya sp. AN02str TaxID=3423363 RepID=UPI003D31FB5D